MCDFAVITSYDTKRWLSAQRLVTAGGGNRSRPCDHHEIELRLYNDSLMLAQIATFTTGFFRRSGVRMSIDGSQHTIHRLSQKFVHSAAISNARPVNHHRPSCEYIDLLSSL